MPDPPDQIKGDALGLPIGLANQLIAKAQSVSGDAKDFADALAKVNSHDRKAVDDDVTNFARGVAFDLMRLNSELDTLKTMLKLG